MSRISLILMLGLLALAMSAGCTHTVLFGDIDENGDAAVGFAYAGDQIVEYQAWQVVSMADVYAMPGNGAGTIYASVTPECPAVPGRGEPRGNRPRVAAEAWSADGHTGWLFTGSGEWSDGMLPELRRVDRWFDPAYRYKCEAARRHKHVNLIEEATHGEKQSTMLIAIVPPVVAVMEDQMRGLRSGMLGLSRWSPDEDDARVITGLWALSPTKDSTRLHGTHLIPEGETMTLGEVRRRGPSLWREQLDEMRQWVEPKPLKR